MQPSGIFKIWSHVKPLVQAGLEFGVRKFREFVKDFLPDGQYADLADSVVAKRITCDNTNDRSEGLLGRMRIDRRRAPNAKSHTLVAREQVRSNYADFGAMSKEQLKAVRGIALQEAKNFSKVAVAREMAAVQREDDNETQKEHERRKAFRGAREDARSRITIVRTIEELGKLDSHQLLKQLQARKVKGYTKLTNKSARFEKLKELIEEEAEVSQEGVAVGQADELGFMEMDVASGINASARRGDGFGEGLGPYSGLPEPEPGHGDGFGEGFGEGSGPHSGLPEPDLNNLFSLWLDTQGEASWEEVNQTRELQDSEEWLQWISLDSDKD